MRRSQTLLAVLSVALGVAAFATVVSLDAWQRWQIHELSVEFASDVLVVRVVSAWPEDVERVQGQGYDLTFEEAQKFASAPGVVEVAFQGSTGRPLGGKFSAQRVPVSESIFSVLGLKFAGGEPFGEEARLFDLPFVVLGSTLAEELFGSVSAAVGQITDLGSPGTTLRVEGVLEPIPAGVAEYQYLNAAALVPNSSSYPYNPITGRPAGSRVFIRYEPGAEELARSGVQEALRTLPTGNVQEVLSSEQWLASQRLFRNKVADELTRGSGWVVLLALIATLGNLMNTLGLRAADRARMLAVRRALGATRLRILAEVVLDGAVIGGAGTLLGLALWPVLARLVNLAEDARHFTPEAVLLAGGAGLAVTLLALVVPSVWLLRLPIYRALREELAPPVWEGVALTGMAAGVLALVVATSIASGAGRWFQERLAEIGADRVVMTTIGGPPDRLLSAKAPPPFDEADVAAIERVPGVLGVAVAVMDPFVVLVKGSTAPDGEPPDFEPVGATRVYGPFFDIYPMPMEYGRAPAALDEVVIGPAAAERAYPGVPLADVVGRPLVLAQQAGRRPVNEESMTIVGILAAGGWDSFGDLINEDIVRLARPEDPPITSSTGRNMHIKIDLTADYETVLAGIRAAVEERHDGYAPAAVHEPAGDLRQVRATMTSVGRAWLTMAWISLVVGGVGLASIVIVRLVKSRSELALKRALGATQARVARISLAMALRIAAYAAVVGLLAGGVVNYWVTTLAPWDFVWPWREAVDSVAVALAVAVLAVILPVVSFSRAQPWAVLKEE